MSKAKTSFSLTKDALILIRMLARKLGIPQSNVVEIAIRKLAEQENISLNDQTSQKKPD